MTSWAPPFTLNLMSVGSAKSARTKTGALIIPEPAVIRTAPAVVVTAAAIISNAHLCAAKEDTVFQVIVLFIFSPYFGSKENSLYLLARQFRRTEVKLIGKELASEYADGLMGRSESV